MLFVGVKRQTSSLWLEIEETQPLDEVTCASHVSGPLSLNVGFPTEASETSRTTTIKPATAMGQLNIKILYELSNNKLRDNWTKHKSLTRIP